MKNIRILSLILFFYPLSFLSAQEGNNPYYNFKEEPLQKKNVYNVAFILPFKSGSLYGVDLSRTDIKVPKEATTTMDFFYGANQALNALKARGLSLNIYLYDNKKSDSITLNILRKIDSLGIDIVVGPFSTKQAGLVSDFCKLHKIYHFVPLNPSDEIDRNNPYLFKLSAPLEKHYVSVYDRMRKLYNPNTLKFHAVIKDKNKNENEIAQFFIKNYGGKIDTARTVTDGNADKVNIVLSNRGQSISKQVIEGRKNIIFFPSHEDRSINATLAGLRNTKNTDISVIGLPTWQESEMLGGSTLDFLNTQITSDCFVDENDPTVKNISKSYAKATKAEISDYAFSGYDCMNYIGTLLLKYGNSFPAYIEDEKYIGISTNYNLKKVLQKDGDIEYFENTFFNLLEYSNGRWNRVID